MASSDSGRYRSWGPDGGVRQTSGYFQTERSDTFDVIFMQIPGTGITEITKSGSLRSGVLDSSKGSDCLLDSGRSPRQHHHNSLVIGYNGRPIGVTASKLGFWDGLPELGRKTSARRNSSCESRNPERAPLNVSPIQVCTQYRRMVPQRQCLRVNR